MLRKLALRKSQLEAMMGIRGSFGALSAYIGSRASKSENKARHGLLVADLQKLGYRWTDLRGQWEGLSEKSVLVPGIKASDLFALGRKYDQDAVIFKGPGGVLAMYNLRDNTAEVAVRREDLSPDFDIAADDSLFSKSRGLSFGFNFLFGDKIPWGGGKPITQADVSKFFAAGLMEAA